MTLIEHLCAVIAMTAYFEALAAAPLPFAMREVRITRRDEIGLAGGSPSAREFTQALLTVAPPRPAPHLPFERFLGALETWYGQLSGRLADFLRGLPVWENLDEASKAAAERFLGGVLCEMAVSRYQELYAQLALEVPEFQAARHDRRPLAQLADQRTRQTIADCLRQLNP